MEEELLRTILEKLDSLEQRIESIRKEEMEFEDVAVNHLESIAEMLARLTNSLTNNGEILAPNSGRSIPETLSRIETQVWALRKK